MGGNEERMRPESGVAVSRKSLFHLARQTLGFRNSYDFVLWMTVSAFMAGFTFIRFPYLHPPTFEARAAPGEWYVLRNNPYHFGIFLHLFTVLPAGFLCIFQFVPAIRSKAMFFHYYSGYIFICLLFIGNLGAIIISPKSMGGDLATQVAVMYLSFSTTSSIYLAWHNIKRHQIDQHRKWMLRASFQMSIIVTMRIIQFLMIVYLSLAGGYHSLWTCDQVMFVTGNTTEFYTEFPSCKLGAHTLVGVAVGLDNLLHIGSAVRYTFGSAIWAAIAVHTIATEIYIHLTPKESERLRNASYYQQKAKGLPNPGSAGITSDRWGDGQPWKPSGKVE